MNIRANEKLNENFDNLYPSKYFKLTDVDGDIVLTIASCEETAFRDASSFLPGTRCESFLFLQRRAS